jgi:serine/threonine protein kinase HipA of HipAB toxin-antitoxin module
MGEDRNVYRLLVGKPQGKSPLGRPRCRQEDGLRLDLREIGWGSVEWIQLAQDRNQWRALVHMVMYLRVLAPWS